MAKSNVPASQQPQPAVNPPPAPARISFLTWLLIFTAAGLVTVLAIFVVLILTAPPIEPMPVIASVPIATPLPPVNELELNLQPTPTPEPTPDPMEGMVLSRLTGLPILEEKQHLRPVAVVVNNHSRALPQSGIAEAELIYEVLAEGNITRLVAIFQQLQAPKIGPVRSVRDYFVDFALENDAVVAHHGGSPSGYARLREHGIDRLDGMILEGTTFWRDPERRRVPALIEHSSFTGAAELETAMYNRGIRREWQTEGSIELSFNLEEIPFEAMARASGGVFRPCAELIVPFSNGYPRRFVYSPELSLYAVYNIHGPHMDAGGEYDEEVHMHVANVLVQLVRSRVISGDEAGRREVSTVGSGSGYLATAGGIVDVRWERDSITSPTRWYFYNGRPLQLTPGQTWINVLQDIAEIEVVERAATEVPPDGENEEDEYDE